MKRYCIVFKANRRNGSGLRSVYTLALPAKNQEDAKGKIYRFFDDITVLDVQDTTPGCTPKKEKVK